MSEVRVWFDGACAGNPGPMGAGAVVEFEGGRETFREPKGKGTNNEAEYHGAILGLRNALKTGAKHLVLHGDSQLILRQLGGTYKVKAANLKALADEAKGLLAQFETHELIWVRRDDNGLADAAARDAISR